MSDSEQRRRKTDGVSMQAERENLFSMIEQTTDQATRATLLVMLAMLDEIASQRSDFDRHRIEEMDKWNAVIGSDLDQEKHAREHKYLEEAIQAQLERKALRRAVIEKTLAGLVWAAVVFAGTMAVGWFTAFVKGIK
jgi:hypothetical protein